MLCVGITRCALLEMISFSFREVTLIVVKLCRSDFSDSSDCDSHLLDDSDEDADYYPSKDSENEYDQPCSGE